MKRKKRIKLVISILVIVAIVIIISKVTGNKDVQIKRLSNLYEELNTSQTYLFEMEKDSDNKTIMAKKGNKTIIDNTSAESHSTTIVKDNNTYLVLHDREEYYVYEQNNVEQTILTDGIGEIVKQEFKTGTEKVKGKKYSYEEYAGSTMFMAENASNVSEEEIVIEHENSNPIVLIIITIIVVSAAAFVLIKLNQKKKEENYY